MDSIQKPLTEDGLMNRGAVVNRIDRKFVQDSFEMRILLESEAAYRATMNRMVIGELLMKVQAVSNHIELVSSEEYEKLNEDIHIRIWNCANNERLSHYLMELWNGPSTGRGVDETREHYRASTDEHIKILEAIRDNKPDEAREAMRRHITRSMNNMLQKYPE